MCLVFGFILINENDDNIGQRNRRRKNTNCGSWRYEKSNESM